MHRHATQFCKKATESFYCIYVHVSPLYLTHSTTQNIGQCKFAHYLYSCEIQYPV